MRRRAADVHALRPLRSWPSHANGSQPGRLPPRDFAAPLIDRQHSTFTLPFSKAGSVKFSHSPRLSQVLYLYQRG
jgi:hypothetical protein